jgi:hypothetical protein
VEQLQPQATREEIIVAEQMDEKGDTDMKDDKGRIFRGSAASR